MIFHSILAASAFIFAFTQITEAQFGGFGGFRGFGGGEFPVEMIVLGECGGCEGSGPPTGFGGRPRFGGFDPYNPYGQYGGFAQRGRRRPWRSQRYGWGPPPGLNFFPNDGVPFG
ncbi:unnamed protein product [Angiostrongylus costaricensis]|uniref:Uncharacterized protein n=1 Tax=Angiostrongylus costaricensis TaxID=334426 RepID=A0A0R3PS41_ANGCS|nr:unnamed protein product [Angiostrongylus costaricensis]